MGVAIDTIGFYRTISTVADTVPGAVTLAPGDSATVRNFPNTDSAKLEAIFFSRDAAGDRVRVRSPFLADNVRGIEFTPGEGPAAFLLPAEVGEPLYAQDTLTIEAENATASTSTAGALSVYYSNLLGASARLHSWGDISGIIEHIKPVEVDASASGTIGNWGDTLINATEDLLEANRDYAVLGYVLDVSCAAVAVKGQDTGNLRVGGPGIVTAFDTSDYFVRMSSKHGTPHIPVINSANKGSIYVSVLDKAASTAVKVQLILALLSSNLPN